MTEASLIERLSTADSADFAALIKEAIEALREYAADEEWTYNLVQRQGDLLTAAINVLRGEPDDDTIWSHHDIAELCRTLKEDNASAVTHLAEALLRIGELEAWKQPQALADLALINQGLEARIDQLTARLAACAPYVFDFENGTPAEMDAKSSLCLQLKAMGVTHG